MNAKGEKKKRRGNEKKKQRQKIKLCQESLNNFLASQQVNDRAGSSPQFP